MVAVSALRVRRHSWTNYIDGTDVANFGSIMGFGATLPSKSARIAPRAKISFRRSEISLNPEPTFEDVLVTLDKRQTSSAPVKVNHFASRIETTIENLYAKIKIFNW